MKKSPEKTATPKAPKKLAPLTPEQLAARLEDTPDGAHAVQLLVQSAISGRQDLLRAALRRLMETALAPAPKKRRSTKAATPAPAAPSGPAPTAAQILADEEKIHAADLIKNLTQPAQPAEVLRQFVEAQIVPSYRSGQRVWSFKPSWKGRPLTSIRETWVQVLQACNIDASRLLLQIAQGHLVVNLNGFRG